MEKISYNLIKIGNNQYDFDTMCTNLPNIQNLRVGSYRCYICQYNNYIDKEVNEVLCNFVESNTIMKIV